jgi:hypothetical protein
LDGRLFRRWGRNCPWRSPVGVGRAVLCAKSLRRSAEITCSNHCSRSPNGGRRAARHAMSSTGIRVRSIVWPRRRAQRSRCGPGRLNCIAPAQQP